MVRRIAQDAGGYPEHKPLVLLVGSVQNTHVDNATEEHKMLNQIQSLINKGLSAYHISQLLKADGKRVYCFGSYYTVGRNIASRVCFYETDNGVKCRAVKERADYSAI